MKEIRLDQGLYFIGDLSLVLTNSDKLYNKYNEDHILGEFNEVLINQNGFETKAYMIDMNENFQTIIDEKAVITDKGILSIVKIDDNPFLKILFNPSNPYGVYLFEVNNISFVESDNYHIKLNLETKEINFSLK